MKIALITGAGRGIGLAISKALLGEGLTCILASRQSSADIEDLQNIYGEKAIFFSLDISLEKDIENIVRFVNENFGGQIDLLVNNAGVAPKIRADLLELTRENFDYVLDINLKGTFFLSQAVAKLMSKNKSGKIINISSLSSYTASTERAEYCIAKAGISMITKLFAARMADDNIGVFEISPGIIKTDMTSGVTEKYQSLIDNGITPIRRFGMPQDIADCVLSIEKGYLDFCTGTVLHADGGFQIRRL